MVAKSARPQSEDIFTLVLWQSLVLYDGTGNPEGRVRNQLQRFRRRAYSQKLKNYNAFRPQRCEHHTTDGDDWAFSRLLIKPFFEREVYHDTDRLVPFVDRFLGLFTKDGETFDVQPLLQRWFLDINTDFIFGESLHSLVDPSRANLAWNMMTALRGARLRAQSHRFIWAFNW
ncbi:Cytochrome P450 52A3-A [Cytospora mali]|uniref:Cytochrome P450 52A3-A n=1 Tax=Cytospora mali TaxID=578113 RepID=A0A194W6Q6_CYTMA|nr:Cytochrome P450 52A3-A [Valsa mali]